MSPTPAQIREGIRTLRPLLPKRPPRQKVLNAWDRVMLAADRHAAWLELRERELIGLVQEAVSIDGAHHKQWYLEELAKLLDIDLSDHEPGVAP